MTTVERSKGTGVRATKQRSAITHALNTIDEFRSAQELHALLKERGEAIGLTTVYRNLQALADAGIVDVLRTENGESMYRLCSGEHHHHLVCRLCGLTVEVNDEALEEWSEATARKFGFTDVNHTIEILGTCAKCS